MSEYAAHYKHGSIETADKIEAVTELLGNSDMVISRTWPTRSSTSTALDSRTTTTRTYISAPTGCTDLSLESF